MSQKFHTQKHILENMTCSGCEWKIEKKLNQLNGIHNVKADFTTNTVSITYDTSKIKKTEIDQALQKLGYKIVTKPSTNTANNTASSKSSFKITEFLTLILGLLAVYVVINRWGGFDFFNAFPQAQAKMGYAALFFIGLMTSIHCVAMCGGINLSECISSSTSIKNDTPTAQMKSKTLLHLTPSLLYNTGRVISYTIIGAVVGTLGSVISFSNTAKAIITLIAAFFMIIMGLNMLNLFPWLRKFSFRLPKSMRPKTKLPNQNFRPFYVGLLNGFMPCGPLSAMQLYALSTGDPLKGALSMFFFSLGTLPLMFGIGAISSLLHQKFARKLTSISAALVVVLGLFMFNNSLALSGIILFPSLSSPPSVISSIPATPEKSTLSTSTSPSPISNFQEVAFDLSPRSYAPLTVKKGMPVKWTIHADSHSLNGCNSELVVSEYNITKKLEIGENNIEFSPDKAGTFVYTCWMGMIKSTITVTE